MHTIGLIPGRVYGGLELISLERNPAHKNGNSYKVFVRCVHCKAEVYRDRSNVQSHSLRSCGCMRRVVSAKTRAKYH